MTSTRPVPHAIANHRSAASERNMDKAWESAFATWAEGPGKSEQDKCDNAESVVRNAIEESEDLAGWDITVRPHGSYRVRTNIKQDSDVDIYVRLNRSDFFDEYPAGKTRTDFGNQDGTLDYEDYKNRVEKALKAYLGDNVVTRGTKAFDVHANTYHIDADVIAVLPYRWYTGHVNGDGSHHYVEGISFRPDRGSIIDSWPDQTYDNGVTKNTATGRRYKRAIRIMKKLRNYMHEHKVAEANGISSFLIECLVWNAPNDAFGDGEYWEDVYRVLSFLIAQTAKSETCKEWLEVNQVLRLWHEGQAWNLPQAHVFLLACWKFLEF